MNIALHLLRIDFVVLLLGLLQSTYTRNLVHTDTFAET